MSRSPDWSWKVAERDENPRLRLAYEPGNWGDVLKALWALPLARAVARGAAQAAGGGAPTLLDAFAGAPTWPLLPAAAERVAWLPPGVRAALSVYTDAGTFPSTGRLLLDAMRAGARAEVFDLDDERRAQWAADERVSVAGVRDGVELLARHSGGDTHPSAASGGAAPPDVLATPASSAAAAQAPGAPDVVLVDPYDLFERFEELLPAALPLARRAPVLLYLYNKAPRSAAAFARYGELRARVDAWLDAHPGHGLLVGRLPGDARLPRAWHELLLVGASDLLDELGEPLLGPTRELAARLAAEGATERRPG